MDVYAMIKQLLRLRGKKMMDIVNGLGVSLQSVNRSLHGNITLSRFVRIVNLTDSEVYIGWTGEDGKLHLSTLDKLEKGWRE